jgi:hypothetical protein
MLAGALAAAAPTTQITAGPTGGSTLTSPTFEFTSDEPGATFECSLDGADFTVCRSPKTVGPLQIGSHNFSVRAIGPDGTPDPAPQVREWDVVPSPVAFAKVRVKNRLRMRLEDFKVVRGTASSPSGVHEVFIALQRGGPDRDLFPPGCTYTDLRTGGTVIQPCLLPHYERAKGTTRWHLKVPARVRRSLRRGTYKLIVRAFNGYNQALRSDFKLTLR